MLSPITQAHTQHLDLKHLEQKSNECYMGHRTTGPPPYYIWEDKKSHGFVGKKKTDTNLDVISYPKISGGKSGNARCGGNDIPLFIHPS